MPDVKISQLPVGTTPTGVEVGPFVQGGQTVQLTAAQIAALASSSLAIVDKGTVSSGTVTFLQSAGAKQKLTVGGSLTVAFGGWPASGIYGEIEVQLVNGGLGVTWPTVNWLVGDGTTSTSFSAMNVTLQNPGTNWVIVWSTNGGVAIYGKAG